MLHENGPLPRHVQHPPPGGGGGAPRPTPISTPSNASSLTNAAAPDAARVAVEFLQRFDRNGRHALWAKVPDGPSEGRTFPPGAWEEMTAWIAERDGRSNLYFNTNEPVADAPHGKLARRHIARVRAIGLDVDMMGDASAYDAERKRLRDLATALAGEVAPPSFIVDSGGGLQAFWLLAEPLDAGASGEAAEEQGRAVAAAYEADSVFDLARVMRLPGTMNLPDAKKRARGRQPRRAGYRATGATCTLAALATRFPPLAKALYQTTVIERDDLHARIAATQAELESYGLGTASSFSELPEKLRTAFGDAMRASDALKTLWLDGTHAGSDQSASARRFKLAQLLRRRGGSTAHDFAELLFVWTHAINAGEDPDERLTPREIARTWERARPIEFDPSEWFEELPDVEPFPRLEGTPALKPAPPSFRVVTGLVEASSIPVRSYIIEPRLPAGDVAQCVGEPGVSKSTLALRDALIVATGREDLLRMAAGVVVSPERLHASGAVLVYNAEDRLSEMERRLSAAQTYYGIAGPMRHPIILWSGVDHGALKIVGRSSDRAPLSRAAGADRLAKVVREHGVTLAILDPQISLSSGGNENSNDDQDTLLQTLADVAAATGCSILVIHHTGKATRHHRGDMGAGRGAFAAVGKVRSAFTLCLVTGDDEESKWGLPAQGRFVRIDYSKISHGQLAKAPIVFRTVSAPVGNGKGIASGTAAALFPDDARAALEMHGDQAPVLELVDLAAMARAANGGQAGKDAAQAEEHRRIAEFADRAMGSDHERQDLRQLLPIISEWMREAGLSRALSERNTKARVTAALRSGVIIDREDGTFRMVVRKVGKATTAPWELLREPVGQSGKTPSSSGFPALDGLDETNAS